MNDLCARKQMSVFSVNQSDGGESELTELKRQYGMVDRGIAVRVLERC